MNPVKYLTIAFMFFSYTTIVAQKKQTAPAFKNYPVSKLTIEPGIGINPAPMTDVSLNNLIQWNVLKRLSITSHTSLNFNGPFKRNFNYITTNYSLSVIQKIGIGTSFYTKKSSHTISLLAGIKCDLYKETMNNPEFERVTVTRNMVSPDFGIMYNGKIGQKRLFFSYRMYIPLYPYPVKGFDINTIESNLANISLEFGLGIRLK